MPSRGRNPESSTSSEERAILLAVREESLRIPDNCALLLSTDSDGARQAIEQCCLKHKLARRAVRTPETGTLRAIDVIFDDLSARQIDATPAWEPACHDRKKRGTTDGACRVLARLNHACDRLADLVARSGRSHELKFHQAFQIQQDASHYFVSGGVPITTDPYTEVGRCAASLLADAVLQHELRANLENRKECTRFLRLAAQGDVDAITTAKIWKYLPSHLLDEAERSMLDTAGLTSKELSMIPHCEGATFIKNVLATVGSEDCPFCVHARTRVKIPLAA